METSEVGRLAGMRVLINSDSVVANCFQHPSRRKSLRKEAGSGLLRFQRKTFNAICQCLAALLIRRGTCDGALIGM